MPPTRILQAPTLSSSSHCYLSLLPQMPPLLLLPRALKPMLPLQYEEFTPRQPVQIGSTAAPPAAHPLRFKTARRPRRPCSPRCPRRRGGPRNLRGAKRKGVTRPVTPAAPDHHGGAGGPGISSTARERRAPPRRRPLRVANRPGKPLIRAGAARCVIGRMKSRALCNRSDTHTPLPRRAHRRATAGYGSLRSRAALPAPQLAQRQSAS